MSLSIELDPDQHNWFSNQDLIRGTASLELRSAQDITQIRIALHGVSRTALTRVDDIGQKFTDQVEDITTFLHISQQLFPPKDQLSAPKYTLQQGKYTFDFEFRFPSINTSGVMQYNLPPSLSDLDMDLASIRYFLEVTCERQLVLGSSIKKTRHYLDFLPSDDLIIERVPTYGAIASSKARVLENVKSITGIFSKLISTLAHDKAPNCHDAAEFVVRSELLITPGVKFTWFLELLNKTQDEIKIYSVKVVLQIRSQIRAKNLDKIVESDLVLLNKKQLNLINPSDLTLALNSPTLIVPESCPPTFKTANIKRDYKILYNIKWGHSPTSQLTHKTEISQRVYLRSGVNSLPNYETGEIYRPAREYPQAKWYYK